MPCHWRRLSMIRGISRGSRPCLRTQPQLRLDCSPAMSPFSHRATDTPRWARCERGAGADDAAADDDDVGLRRRRRIQRVPGRPSVPWLSDPRQREQSQAFLQGGIDGQLGDAGRVRADRGRRPRCGRGRRAGSWSPAPRRSTAALMSETTKPGQTATARMPSSQPVWRTAWVRARAANLLTE